MKEDSKPTALPGDGLRSVKTTNVFRAVNFELYTKPNKVVMGFGVVAIGCSLGYLAYMRYQASVDAKTQCIVELDDGAPAVVPRRSNWDM